MLSEVTLRNSSMSLAGSGATVVVVATFVDVVGDAVDCSGVERTGTEGVGRRAAVSPFD